MPRMRIRIDPRACVGCDQLEDAHETHGSGVMCGRDDRHIRWVQTPPWFGKEWPLGMVPRTCGRKAKG